MKRTGAAFILAAVAAAFMACGDQNDRATTDAGPDSSLDVPVPVPVPVPDSGIADASPDANADAAPSGCPAGSTFLRSRTTCPGAPLLPPAALTTALAAATPGDVVSLSGMIESDAPCLPVVVCTPGDAPAMLFSDSPESPSQDGVLYADTVAAGRHRFYVYHANGSAAARKFPIVALNTGALPATITIAARGLAAPSTAYVSVGKSVLFDWLTPRAPASVVVPAGQRVLLDAALDQLHAAQNELVHAIYDVTTDKPLKISFVSVLANADAAALTAGLSLLPRDVGHQRGTFPAADVLVTAADVPGGAQKKGLQRLRLGASEVDEPLEGVDATTGDKQTLLGNYGMRYRLALHLPIAAMAAVSPRGGGWGGAARGATKFALPAATEQLATTTEAIFVGGLGASELDLLTGGGSNLPIDLFLVTP